MDAEIFIALINPAMLAIFAAAFMLLWLHQRRHRYIALLAVGMLALAGGFLLNYFAPFGIAASRIVSNLLFVGGGVALVAAVLGRYGRRPPLRLVLGIAGTGFTIFLWFLFVVPDLTTRILTINFTFGAVTLVLARELSRVPDRRLIDQVMFGAASIFGIAFFVRPLAAVWVEGPYLSYDDLYDTIYWITLTFSASICLLVFCLAMITAIALDVIDEFRRESNTDPLSGLLNRRGFEEASDAIIADCRRQGQHVALVVCDLDNFKRINDCYGHGCGDRAIVAVAECLARSAERRYPVSRPGGEEFAMLMPRTSLPMARLFAEGARGAIASVIVAGAPADLSLTASFGVARLEADDTLADLMERADRALYEAKRSGRDRVCVSAEPERHEMLVLPERAIASGA